ncbi:MULTISPECIES: D-sedoheptulose-7-phosphate isomerase [Streptomyces]|uniref:SIS domain-containing protein n=1 Tax=Streptomyces flaveolus TaxID=67297 RepID=A0ABV3AMG2_9ACTN|nr:MULTISPECIES: SIS domain-containing protein [Streptomyces]KMS83449.1 sugar isomerase [Streptomyces regensis]
MAKDPGQQLADHVDLARRVGQLLPQLLEVSRRLVEIYEAGGRLYTFGNGGSAADAQHLAAELVGRYLRERRPLPALALSVDPSVTTCIGNDYDFDDLFSRQVEAFASPGDMVLAFTTSGRSQNVVRGLKTARDRGALTVLFGGGDGGPAAEHADLALLVPSAATARIQEMHLMLLHLLSEQIDAWAAEDTPA